MNGSLRDFTWTVGTLLKYDERCILLECFRRIHEEQTHHAAVDFVCNRTSFAEPRNDALADSFLPSG